jgi:hypothetical protein
MNLDSAPCTKAHKKKLYRKENVGKLVASGERGISIAAEQSYDTLRLAVYRQSVSLGDKPLEIHNQ